MLIKKWQNLGIQYLKYYLILKKNIINNNKKKLSASVLTLNEGYLSKEEKKGKRKTLNQGYYIARNPEELPIVV